MPNNDIIHGSADFSPAMGEYKTLQPFRYWCQKVLPLVYDESLSYYELLCKVIDYLNRSMEDVETLHGDIVNLHDAYESLEDYTNDTFNDMQGYISTNLATIRAEYAQLVSFVNSYFNNLDVQNEINNKLDAMASSGALSILLAPFIPDLVTAWLNTHVTPTTPVVDDTLSISGAAADAKVTGDGIRRLTSDLSETNGRTAYIEDTLLGGEAKWVDDVRYTTANRFNPLQVELGLINSSTGVVDTTVSNRFTTNLMRVTEGLRFRSCKYNGDGTSSNIARYSACYYDENYQIVSGTVDASNTFVGEDIYWVRFSFAGTDSINNTMCLFDTESIPASPAEYIPYGGTPTRTLVHGTGDTILDTIDTDEKYQKATEDYLKGERIITYSRNMLDNSKVVAGLLQDDGTIEAATNRVTTDFIPIPDGETNYLLWHFEGSSSVNNLLRKALYYNENKEVISSFTGNPSTFNQEGAKYIRLTYDELYKDTTMLFMGDISRTGVTEFIPYAATPSVAYGKKYKIIANGDSIVFGHKPDSPAYATSKNGVSYVTMACDELGFELENDAISASTLTFNTDGTDTHDALVGRYNRMSNDADLVYISIGCNDWYYDNSQLGEMSDRVNNTFYGAMHLLCQGLREKYGNIPIIFATPIKRWIPRDPQTIPGNQNLHGEYITGICTAIKEVCEYYGMPVLDLYGESFLNAWESYDRTNWVPDGTHPNDLGHDRIKISFKAMLLYYLQLYGTNGNVVLLS